MIVLEQFQRERGARKLLGDRGKLDRAHWGVPTDSSVVGGKRRK